MKKFTKILLLTGLIMLTTQSFAQDSNFYIYLCFGQSNMEGQGEIQEQDRKVDVRFQVLQSYDCSNLAREGGKWYPAVPPLCQCYSGLSPADYFGRTMVAILPDSIKIGVINVAIGGCDIRIFDKEHYLDFDDTYKEDWFVDKVKAYNGNPYNHLLQLAKIAQKSGVIKGILLHQGETNTSDEQWPNYVNKVYTDMLKDLTVLAEDVPLLAGEVVGEDNDGVCAAMNPIINKLPDTIHTAHVISSKGCDVKEDKVHFNAEGYRKLGRRYAVKMLEIMGVL
ncbi:MAG: sialate O-acetylesterase [Candidatus Marinimicrobia bacterium]|nr:sialate O-acetylesterase [Candidatus Neomarinimicrobiota bacterium]